MNTKKIFMFATISCIFIGIISGSVCMSVSSCENEMYEYLMRCFDSFSNSGNRFDIFKNSLSGNLKLFSVITVCAFFKFGIAGSLFCCFFKGFTSGFTTAAFVKYYGINGLIVPLSSSLSALFILPVTVFFSAYSANFALKKHSKDKDELGKFLLLSLICFFIFFAASLADGYVTPVFIKLLRSFLRPTQI